MKCELCGERSALHARNLETLWVLCCGFCDPGWLLGCDIARKTKVLEQAPLLDLAELIEQTEIGIKLIE